MKRMALILGILMIMVVILSIQTSCAELDGQVVSVPGGSYRIINSEQLHRVMPDGNIVMINVHVPYEGEIPHTDLFIPYNEIEKYSDRLPQDKGATIVIYCRSGRMGDIAAEKLVQMGYTNVYNLREGMKVWGQKGYRVFYNPRMS
ncbi:rhodanese-like domain-containing protein [Methanooceanicella nereidis]|nr:rhodanese-like domain-containing protein [Methanocella sp. CWC-04]